MANDDNMSPYDWDDHFEIATTLRDLDLYYLQITHRAPLQKDMVRHYLVREFRDASKAANGKLRLDDCFHAIARSVDRITDLADRHADRSAIRAHMICDYLEDMRERFYEGRWRPFVEKEVETRGIQLNDMRDHLDSIRPVYFDDGVMTHDDRIWDLARQSIEIEISHHEDIRASIHNGKESDMDQSFIRLRSRQLSRQQDKMAIAALSHAGIQVELLEESIRLLTTIKLLPTKMPEVHQQYLKNQIESLTRMTGDLIISTDFTLTEAADQQNSAELSRSINRPIFKGRYP